MTDYVRMNEKNKTQYKMDKKSWSKILSHRSCMIDKH